MIQVKCNQAGHYETLVQALCLRQDCKNSSACCIRCMKLHPDCDDYLIFLEDVPEAMMQLTTLRNWFIDSYNDVKQLIAKLENIMNQHFLPIDEYTHSPTLTNLNRLGQMLKDSKPQDILVLDKQKQKILIYLDEFNDMLFNAKEPLAEKHYKEGEELQNNKQYLEAIECYDKALLIDKEHYDSLFQKGYSLFMSRKYQEAIDCFDQCLKIDLNNKPSNLYKGWSLQQMNKNEEAIKYFDEQIKLTPEFIYSYINKGVSLRRLSRWKDAQSCFIEGLKYDPNNENLKQFISQVKEEMKKQK